MSNIAKTILGLAVAGLLALTGYTVNLQSDLESRLGGNSGPETFEHSYARQAETIGGNVLATTSSTAATYTQANFSNVTLIQHTAASTLSVTLPASSTLSDFARNPGDTRTIYVTPVTTGITFVGGTGTDFDTASSTKF